MSVLHVKDGHSFISENFENTEGLHEQIAREKRKKDQRIFVCSSVLPLLPASLSLNLNEEKEVTQKQWRRPEDKEKQERCTRTQKAFQQKEKRREMRAEFQGE